MSCAKEEDVGVIAIDDEKSSHVILDVNGGSRQDPCPTYAGADEFGMVPTMSLSGGQLPYVNRARACQS
jgi:hypothetical protein